MERDRLVEGDGSVRRTAPSASSDTIRRRSSGDDDSRRPPGHRSATALIEDSQLRAPTRIRAFALPDRQAVIRRFATAPDDAVLQPDPGLTTTQRRVTTNSTMYGERALQHKRKGFKKLVVGDLVKESSRKDGAALVEVLKSKHLARDAAGYVKAGHLEPLTSYRPVEEAIMDGDPSIGDVRQGAVGDCYLLAALISVVADDSGLIKGMFSPDPTQPSASYAVRFYEPPEEEGRAPRPQWVRVENSLPERPVAVNDDNPAGPVMARGPQRWPGIVEKAFAAYRGVSMNDLGSAGFILNNVSSVLGAITGKAAYFEEFSVDYQASRGRVEGEDDGARRARVERELAKRAIAIIHAGHPVFAGTPDGFSDRQREQARDMGLETDGTGAAGEQKLGGLAAKHAYSVLGLERKGRRLYVRVRNPWSEYGRTEYDAQGDFRVVNGPDGAESLVDFRDFMDAFRKIHHLLSAEEVDAAIAAVEDEGFLDEVDYLIEG